MINFKDTEVSKDSNMMEGWSRQVQHDRQHFPYQGLGPKFLVARPTVEQDMRTKRGLYTYSVSFTCFLHEQLVALVTILMAITVIVHCLLSQYCRCRSEVHILF